MSGLDDWSHPEIVRNLKDLTTAVKDLVTEVRALDDKYVTRREQKLRDAHVDQMLEGLGKAVVDVEADAERHRRQHADTSAATWRAWVAPIVTGAAVAVVAVLLAQLVGG